MTVMAWLAGDKEAIPEPQNSESTHLIIINFYIKVRNQPLGGMP